MGRKRIELFGEDRNKRSGWLTLGNSLTSSNFVLEKYNNYFKGDLCYPEVQGYEGGRYVGTTEEIEELRPRSPTRQANINPIMFAPVNNNGINVGNIGVNPMIPLNFPFVGNPLQNQIQNINNIQRNNINNIPPNNY